MEAFTLAVVDEGLLVGSKNVAAGLGDPRIISLVCAEGGTNVSGGDVGADAGDGFTSTEIVDSASVGVVLLEGVDVIEEGDATVGGLSFREEELGACDLS